MSEDITIATGKYDWLWATHDTTAQGRRSDTLIVMIHGFPGDSRSYGNVFGQLTPMAASVGFHVLRFDMRGCGQSNKKAQFFNLHSAHEDCVAVLKWAQKQGYKKFFFVTEGLGAIVALTTLTEAIRAKVKGMVLMWPMLDLKTSWLGHYLSAAEEAAKSGLDHIAFENADVGLQFMTEVRDYNLTPLLSRITMPVLVQHGSNDSKSPVSQLEPLRHQMHGELIEIVIYPDGEHGLKDSRHRDELLREVMAFFKKNA